MHPSDLTGAESFDAFERDLLQVARARTAPDGARNLALHAAMTTYRAAPGGPLSEGGLNEGFPRGAAPGWRLSKLAGAAGLAGIGAVAVLLAAHGVGVHAVGAVSSTSPRPAMTSAPHAVSSSPESRSSSEPPPGGAEVWSVEDLPAAVETQGAPRVIATARPARTEEGLSAELALLDRVRGATASGEPARALALLDDYRARFPVGVMASEADVLRIEATGRTGNLAAARRLAKTFLAAHEHSPYAKRIASVVGGDE